MEQAMRLQALVAQAGSMPRPLHIIILCKVTPIFPNNQTTPSTIYNKCPFFPKNATHVWLYNKKNVFLHTNKFAKKRANTII